MSEIVLHDGPRFAGVLGEQLRAVGLGLRREATYLAVLLTGFTLLVAYNAVRARQVGHTVTAGFTPQSALPMVLLALVVPLAVWKGEEPGRREYFWSLPVARGPHTLARVAAGWVWLNVGIVGFWAWGVALPLVTGGPVGMQRNGAPIAGWLWAAPFTGAAVMYLLGTTVVLASDHPWRWLAGIVIGWMIVNASSNGPGLEGLHEAIHAIWAGRYGLGAALTGAATEVRQVATASGAVRSSTRTMWSYEVWRGATAVWMTIGLVGTITAAFVHQERVR